MEPVPGTHRIESPMGDRYVCSYLVVGSERSVLIDSGIASTPADVLAPYFDSIGYDPRTLSLSVTSHSDADHSGGNAGVRELAPDASFLCHRLDRDLIDDVERLIERRYREFANGHGVDFGAAFDDWVRENTTAVPIDLALSGGELMRIGPDRELIVLNAPGHSRGHIAVHDPANRAAIVTDAVLGHAVLDVDGNPALPPTYRYVDPYLATISLLEALELETLLTGHFPVYRGDEVAAFLADTRGFVERLDAAIARVLQGADKALTTPEVMDAIDPAIGGWSAEVHANSVFPIVGHLERFALYGRAETTTADGAITWRWA